MAQHTSLLCRNEDVKGSFDLFSGKPAFKWLAQFVKLSMIPALNTCKFYSFMKESTTKNNLLYVDIICSAPHSSAKKLFE